MRSLPDIEQTFFMKAPPSRVFAALTDSKELVNWFAAKASVDDVEGGRFSFVFKNGFVWEGKLSDFKVNKSVSFPWIEGTVSFSLLKKKNGTLLKLRSGGFETVDVMSQSSGGWSYYLTNLKSVLEHGTDLRSKEDGF